MIPLFSDLSPASKRIRRKNSIYISLGPRMKVFLAVLALINAGPVAADCPKAADWARAFYSEHYSFYADPSDRVLQFTTPEFGALLKEGMGIFEGRDRASGLRPLAWRPGRRNWQAGSLLRRNGVAGYGNCLHVISVRA